MPTFVKSARRRAPLASLLFTLLGCTDPLEIGSASQSGDDGVQAASRDAGASDANIRSPDGLAQAAQQIAGSWRTTLPLAGPSAPPSTLVLRFDPLDSRPRGGRWSLSCETNCELPDAGDGGFGAGGSPGLRLSPLAIFQDQQFPISGDYWMLMEIDDAKVMGIIRSNAVAAVDILFDRSRSTLEVNFGFGVIFSNKVSRPRFP